MRPSSLKILRMLAPIFSWFYALLAVLLTAGQGVLIPFLFGEKPGARVFPFSLLLLPLLTAAVITLCCLYMPRTAHLWPEIVGVALSAGPLVLLRLLLVNVEATALERIGPLSAAVFTYLNTALRYCDFVNALATALFLVACGMSLAQKGTRKTPAKDGIGE